MALSHAPTPGISGAPHGIARYEMLRELGSGNFGVARLMRDKITGELVAIKFIDRGERVRTGRRAQGRTGPAHAGNTLRLLHPGGQECGARDPQPPHAEPSQHHRL